MITTNNPVNKSTTEHKTINENINKTTPKKRQEKNIDTVNNIKILNNKALPYEELQNKITDIQITKQNLKNTSTILEKMRNILKNKKTIDYDEQKKLKDLQEELDFQKKEIEDSIKNLNKRKETENINLNSSKESQKQKEIHMEFIKNLKNATDLTKIHKGLNKEKVASLLS